MLTFTKIFAYLGAVLLLALGVSATMDGLEGLFIVAAGLFALPAVRDPITDRLDVSIPGWAVLAIVLVLLAIGMRAGGRMVMA